MNINKINDHSRLRLTSDPHFELARASSPPQLSGLRDHHAGQKVAGNRGAFRHVRVPDLPYGHQRIEAAAAGRRQEYRLGSPLPRRQGAMRGNAQDGQVAMMMVTPITALTMAVKA